MIKKNLLLGGIFLLLTGCGTLFSPPSEESKKIILECLPDSLKKTSGRKGHFKNKQIVVDHPLVFSPLDGTRVAVKVEAHEIDYYAQLEWGERLSTLIQDSIIYSLQNSHHFMAVTRNAEGILPDYILKTEVRQFYVQREKGSLKATIEYFFQVVKSVDRQVIDQKTSFHQVALKDETMPEVIRSLNQAHLKVMLGLKEWLQ